jgi:hypothetical protein
VVVVINQESDKGIRDVQSHERLNDKLMIRLLGGAVQIPHDLIGMCGLLAEVTTKNKL